MPPAEARMLEGPRILTTVVGSYPVPSWLAAQPSEPNLRDALLVVLKTQELAGTGTAWIRSAPGCCSRR